MSVIGIQIGYLFGSLVALERIFNYPGLGSTHLQRRRQRRTSRSCQAAVILVGIIYMICTLVADLIIAWMNPRARLEQGDLTMNVTLPDPASAAAVVDELAEAAAHEDLVTAEAPPGAAPIDTRAERRQARKERLAAARRRPGLHHRRA